MSKIRMPAAVYSLITKARSFMGMDRKTVNLEGSTVPIQPSNRVGISKTPPRDERELVQMRNLAASRYLHMEDEIAKKDKHIAEIKATTEELDQKEAALRYELAYYKLSKTKNDCAVLQERLQDLESRDKAYKDEEWLKNLPPRFLEGKGAKEKLIKLKEEDPEKLAYMILNDDPALLPPPPAPKPRAHGVQTYSYDVEKKEYVPDPLLG